MSRLAWKYAVGIAAIVALTAGVVGGGIYWNVKTELVYRLPDAADQALGASMMLAHINEGLWVTVPILLAVVLLVSVVGWRRIAAPEVELVKMLHAIAQGDLTVGSDGRRGRDLAELVRLTEEVRTKWGAMVGEERQALNQAVSACSDLLREVDQGKTDKRRLQEVAQGLLTHLEQLQVLSSRFKVKTL